jgi:hypothetical protein
MSIEQVSATICPHFKVTDPNNIHGLESSLSTDFQLLVHNTLTGDIGHIYHQWLALIACQT